MNFPSLSSGCEIAQFFVRYMVHGPIGARDLRAQRQGPTDGRKHAPRVHVPRRVERAPSYETGRCTATTDASTTNSATDSDRVARAQGTTSCGRADCWRGETKPTPCRLCARRDDATACTCRSRSTRRCAGAPSAGGRVAVGPRRPRHRPAARSSCRRCANRLQRQVSLWKSAHAVGWRHTDVSVDLDRFLDRTSHRESFNVANKKCASKLALNATFFHYPNTCLRCYRLSYLRFHVPFE